MQKSNAMIALSVNVNKIALIRNSREGNNPDVVTYAQQCIAFGAHGITVHPRPDQRHIRAADCYDLKKALSVELNIEGNPFAGFHASNRSDVNDYPGFMPLVRDTLPAQCTLVPDNTQQLTSDHGFDLKHNTNALQDIIAELKALNIRVSLFMDCELEQLQLARQIGADRVEFYTGPYANANNLDAAFIPYQRAAEYALAQGLEINAGHDLNLHNLPRFAHLPGLSEVSIGHALTIDALQYGLESTIMRYLAALHT